MEQMLSAHEIAQVSGISYRKVLEIVRAAEQSGHAIALATSRSEDGYCNGKYLIRPSEFDAFIRKGGLT